MTLTYEITIKKKEELVMLDSYDIGAYNIWGDGSYIYAVTSDGIHAFIFDGNSLSLLNSIDDGVTYYNVWGDGTYIYCATSDGIYAYTFDGADFTLKGSKDDGNTYYGIWGYGGYIYCACNDSGIRAYTFDGTTFTLKGSKDDGDYYLDVDGDGTYIYCACYDSGIRAYTFNGTNFTLKGTQYDGGSYYNIFCDGAYVLCACDSLINAYLFNGTDFTLIDSQWYDAFNIWGAGSYIYVLDEDGILYLFEFDGVNFIEKYRNNYNIGHIVDGIWSDGDIICVSNRFYSIQVYKVFPEYVSAIYDQSSKDILSIEVRNNKAQSYNTGTIVLINAPIDIVVGYLVGISINGSEVFKGFVSDVCTSSAGVRQTTLNLLGLTALLFKDTMLVGGEGPG